MNGEFYKGGQFVAGSEKTIKGMNQVGLRAKSNWKARRVLIAPGEYAVQPSENHRSIYGHVGVALFYENGRLEINKRFIWSVMGWTDEGHAKVCALAERWNNGERWYLKDEVHG